MGLCWNAISHVMFRNHCGMCGEEFLQLGMPLGLGPWTIFAHEDHYQLFLSKCSISIVVDNGVVDCIP